MAKQLTKKELQEVFGVTSITEDGRIFCGEKEMVPYNVLGPVRKYSGNQKKYHMLSKYSKGKTITVLWHRAVWAWFNDVAPSNMDVDHIDNNPFNNSISNLQLLTREENLAKRGGFKNQWEAMRQDIDWVVRKGRIENLKNEIKMANATVKHLRELLKTCKQEWHDAPKGVRKIIAHHNVKICELDLENAIKVWRKLIQQLNRVKGE